MKFLAVDSLWVRFREGMCVIDRDMGESIFRNEAFFSATTGLYDHEISGGRCAAWSISGGYVNVGRFAEKSCEKRPKNGLRGCLGQGGGEAVRSGRRAIRGGGACCEFVP